MADTPRGGIPSTRRLKRLARQRAYRTPRDVRLEQSEKPAGPLVISFPIPEADWRSQLTPAEIEVAEDALAGLNNAQIASKRGSAVRTVANQLAAIYRKLNVRSRLELSLYALAGL